jgi:hypothetical protein
MASDLIEVAAATEPRRVISRRMPKLRGARVLLGAVLLVFAMTPIYRLLDPAETGRAGEATLWFMDIHLEFVWFGLLLMLPVAIACARFLPVHVEARLALVPARVVRVPVVTWALACALASLVAGAAFSLLVLEGQPNLIDSFAQLLQARYWAAGSLAGPASDLNGFWSIQNSLFTDRGWVSQYPPGHVIVLAAFLKLGLPWAAGPVLMAVTVLFTTLAAARLIPERPLAVRLGALLLACSPLFVVIGASYMNHVTTAALVSLAAWALLRAWQEKAAWALLAGAALGWSLMTRPLSTVAMAAALALLIPFVSPARFTALRFGRIMALAATGALPFIGLLLGYNYYFFGDPFTFGYEIAMGPQMRLGFLSDPWGNHYGPVEALAYTSADIMALGVNLLESPLSAVALIGVFLIVARTLSAGERVLVAWALAPVVSNFFYWHHGNFMGPRMLHEVLPAWTVLLAVSIVHLVRRIDPLTRIGQYRPRAAVAGAVVASTAVGLLLMAPQRALSYGGSWYDVTRTPLPEVERPALVFVHDAWMARVTMTLASNRYRLDFVETLMRENSTCEVQALADAVVAGNIALERVLLSRLDTVPRGPGRLPISVDIAPGDRIKVWEQEVMSAECMRQIRADQNGILDLAPLVWRGDLPVSAARGPLFARDFGPERNAELIRLHPEREPWLYTLPSANAKTPVLLPYEDGMRRVWGAQ